MSLPISPESQAVRAFVDRHYHHFNAASLKDAARGWIDQLESGNQMLLAMAGAMSTAELGISLAEMIRRGKLHAISLTGANLEEDIFNLVAHDHYERVPHYRELSAKDEADLLARHLNRVTDTCIPEAEAMRRIEALVLELWMDADAKGESYFPHEFLYKLLLSGKLEGAYQIDPANSWLLAAAERDLPLFVPGWEDSTLGNMFAAACVRGDVKNVRTMKSGVEYMLKLIGWYQEQTVDKGLGFFQIGGGIAGDFPICVVPLIDQDLETEVRVWSYFAQISDSTTSFGSYSGAVPNEKITWGKLAAETPKFIVESDASIVAPLIFHYVLSE
ncbi:MAG: deoxyhypusine synthase family protein [Planctomycetota bacterium]|nr:deoxyhypusine synthase family protein [Planctomycetota bacterium]